MRYSPFLFGLVVLLLLSGCTNKENDNNGTGAFGTTCEEFCVKQPHIQCLGNWRISGTPSACRCDFECNDGGPLNMSDNGSSTTNNTVVPGNNATNITTNGGTQNQTTPVGNGESNKTTIAPHIDNRTLDQVIEANILSLKNQFYRNYGDGTYKETTSKVVIGEMNQGDPREVTFENPLYQMPTFNEKTLPELRAFSMQVFIRTPSQRLVALYASAVGSGERTGLDDYATDMTFKINYGNKEYRNCLVDSKETTLTSNGKNRQNYFIICQTMENMSG